MPVDSTLPSLPDIPTVPQVVDFIWNHYHSSITSGQRAEISLPAELKSIIGDHGIQTLASRFSQALQQEVKTDLLDSSTPPSIRLLATKGPYVRTSTNMAGTQSQRVAGGKVPRPPNPFILFRQTHHPQLKASHPDMTNTEISIALGRQWKEAPEEFRGAYKRRAEHLRRIHKENHPDYQYNPRKASDRKRRMTKAKAAQLHDILARLPTVETATPQDHNEVQVPVPSESAPSQERGNEFDWGHDFNFNSKSGMGMFGEMGMLTDGDNLLAPARPCPEADFMPSSILDETLFFDMPDFTSRLSVVDPQMSDSAAPTLTATTKALDLGSNSFVPTSEPALTFNHDELGALPSHLISHSVFLDDAFARDEDKPMDEAGKVDGYLRV